MQCVCGVQSELVHTCIWLPHTHKKSTDYTHYNRQCDMKTLPSLKYVVLFYPPQPSGDPWKSPPWIFVIKYVKVSLGCSFLGFCKVQLQGFDIWTDRWKMKNYLDWIYQSLDSNAGDPTDDAADGQFPVVLVIAAGGSFLFNSYFTASVIILCISCPWKGIQ